MDIVVLDRPGLARLIDTVPSVASALLVAIVVRVSERLRATNAKVRGLVAENQALRDNVRSLSLRAPDQVRGRPDPQSRDPGR